jgi:hypothetical protein
VRRDYFDAYGNLIWAMDERGFITGENKGGGKQRGKTKGTGPLCEKYALYGPVPAMTPDVEEIAGYWTYPQSSDHSKSSDPDFGEVGLQLATEVLERKKCQRGMALSTLKK